MNLEGKIELIKEAVIAIKNAILGKGVTPTGNVSTYADAINEINVVNNQSKTATSNGVVRYDDGYTGLEQVTVNVQPNLTTKTITTNGVYNASSDSVDGYSAVTVVVANPSEDIIDGSIDEIDTSVTSIRSSAFKNCEYLDTVILRSNTVVDLSNNTIFENTPIASKTGNIYVPDNLINSYKGFSVPIKPSSLSTNNIGAAYCVNDYFTKGFIVKGSVTRGFLISDDSKNWEDGGSITSNVSGLWTTISYKSGVFVSLSTDGYAITGSPKTWKKSSSSVLGSNKTWQASTADTNYFYALATGGYKSKSQDGITWETPTNTSLGLNNWRALCYGNNKIVALGFNGNVSIDWNSPIYSSYLGDNNWVSLTYDGSKFIALGQLGHISISTDGENWTEAIQDTNLATYDDWTSILAYGNNLIAISTAGYVSIKTDYNFLPIS